MKGLKRAMQISSGIFCFFGAVLLFSFTVLAVIPLYVDHQQLGNPLIEMFSNLVVASHNLHINTQLFMWMFGGLPAVLLVTCGIVLLSAPRKRAVKYVIANILAIVTSALSLACVFLYQQSFGVELMVLFGTIFVMGCVMLFSLGSLAVKSDKRRAEHNNRRTEHSVTSVATRTDGSAEKDKQLASKLQQLKRLLEAKAITQDEYQKLVKKYIDN